MNTRLFSIPALIAFLLIAGPVAPEAAGDPPAAKAEPANAKDEGGIVTLYALDPLARTFSFGDGRYGMAVHKRVVYNRASDIDFGGYNSNSFSVGVEGGRVGVILDLGTAADLKDKYGYAEAVGGGQGFVSIHRNDREVLIFRGGNPPTFQAMKDIDALFKEGKSVATAPVKLGHIYLVRLTDDNEKKFDRMVKILVIAHRPNESVTIRWALLN